MSGTESNMWCTKQITTYNWLSVYSRTLSDAISVTVLPSYPIPKKSGTSTLPRILAGDCRYHGYAEVEWGSLRDIQRIITEFMSAPPGHPFNVGFRGLVHVANTPRSPRSLTHDDMFKVVDSAISSLQSSTICDGRRDRCTCSYHKRSTKWSKQVYLPFSY